MSARFCQTLVLAPTCAVARSEQPKARGRSRPERTRLYVRIGDDRERRDATLIATALRGCAGLLELEGLGPGVAELLEDPGHVAELSGLHEAETVVVDPEE